MTQQLTYKQGLEICPSWLKLIYRRSVDFQCQNCHKYEDQVGCLQIHRIKRGNQGGLYTLYPLNHKLNNVKVVCRSCHKKLHSNEFKNIQS